MIRFLPRRALWAGLAFMGISVSAVAGQLPSTGLGQAWPNTQDVSASPHWHVYAFMADGVRYLQVNDLDGNVRAAFAVGGSQFLALPMGLDAQRLTTPQQPLALVSTVVPLASYAETVYNDGSTQLTAVPLSDGTTMFEASPSTTSAVAPCDDPEQCSGHSP